MCARWSTCLHRGQGIQAIAPLPFPTPLSLPSLARIKCFSVAKNHEKRSWAVGTKTTSSRSSLTRRGPVYATRSEVRTSVGCRGRFSRRKVALCAAAAVPAGLNVRRRRAGAVCRLGHSCRTKGCFGVCRRGGMVRSSLSSGQARFLCFLFFLVCENTMGCHTPLAERCRFLPFFSAFVGMIHPDARTCKTRNRFQTPWFRVGQ